MQEHLIPQDISNYKFHLIGELDLKQFGECMAGVIIAVIVNQMSWPDIIKWPIMIASVGFGLLSAFVPIGGQPVSHWIVVFFKALFSPTKFYWRKQTVIPSYFTYELPARNREFLEANSTFNDSPARKHKALAYFSTLNHQDHDNDDPLERFTDNNIAKATKDFEYDTTPVETSVIAPQKVLSKPQVGNEQSVRQRQILTPTQESLNAFLESSSYFQPQQIMEQITGVDDKMEHSDTTLAAALTQDNQIPADVVTVATPANHTNLTPEAAEAATTAIVNTPDTTFTSPIAPNTDSISGVTITPVTPVTPVATSAVNVTNPAIDRPTGNEIVLPTLTNDIDNSGPTFLQNGSLNLNPHLDQQVTLPDMNAVTPIYTTPEMTTATTNNIELPGTPVFAAPPTSPPNPPLKISQ
ncbi:PrgI family protein [bacterium]|nr:PrgI family protein [bacterium]